MTTLNDQEHKFLELMRRGGDNNAKQLVFMIDRLCSKIAQQAAEPPTAPSAAPAATPVASDAFPVGTRVIVKKNIDIYGSATIPQGVIGTIVIPPPGFKLWYGTNHEGRAVLIDGAQRAHALQLADFDVYEPPAPARAADDAAKAAPKLTKHDEKTIEELVTVHRVRSTSRIYVDTSMSGNSWTCRIQFANRNTGHLFSVTIPIDEDKTEAARLKFYAKVEAFKARLVERIAALESEAK